MDEEKRQEALHESMTENEEAYHAAYPDVRAPIMGTVFAALMGKNGKGMLLWGLVGVLAAGLVWASLAYWVL